MKHLIVLTLRNGLQPACGYKISETLTIAEYNEIAEIESIDNVTCQDCLRAYG